MTTKASPYDTATAKLYFVNMLSNGTKYTTFNEAIYEQPKLCLIADKLKYEELSFLIDRIESNF